MKYAALLAAVAFTTGCGESKSVKQRMTKLVDELCACEDRACVDEVQTKLDAIGKEVGDDEGMVKELMPLIQRGMACITKVGTKTAKQPAPDESAATPAADSPAPAKPKAPPAPALSLAEEVAEVRADSGADLGVIGAKVRKLASRGSEARPALLELAVDAKLSENHRQVAGALSAEVHLFRPAKLTELALTSDNNMQVVGAAHSLALLGGAAHHATLDKVVARFTGKDARLVEAVQMMLKSSPATTRLSDHQLGLLDKIYGLRVADDINIYGAALITDHRSNLGWALERMLKLPMERDHQLTIMALKRALEGAK